MIWFGFADNPPPPPSPRPDEDSAPRPEEGVTPAERESLFTDLADDDEQMLRPSDLDAIDESMNRARQAVDVPPTNEDLSEAIELAEDEEAEDDAVEDAAADASIAFVESHGEDGPPVAEPEPEGPVEWLVPWVISLAAHAGLVIAAVFIVWSVQQAFVEEDVIVPIVTLSETPGPPLEVQVAERVETPTETMAPVPAPTPTPMEADLELDLALPGLGEPVAAEAPSFELTIDDAAEFDTNFYGSGGNAKKIVFVLEADGSIISDYPQIVDELARSLRDLSEKQEFSVVVFDGTLGRNGEPIAREVPPSGLKRATADAKAKTIQWLRPASGNVETRRTGDPIMALKIAFSRRPELIFLLSQNLYNPGRGKYELERGEILDAVKRGARGNVVVNTIQFNNTADAAGTIDPQTGQPRPTLLEEIAQITGGEYLKVVTNSLP